MTVGPQNDQETVVADYCSYNGSWRGSTHYHPAYHDFWWGTRGRIDTQYRKLQIERGDWDYARKALELMTEIGEGRLIVDADGRLQGHESTEFSESELMKIFMKEDVPFPHVPEMYFRLALSGRLRDLAEELEEICAVLSMRPADTQKVATARIELKSVRREIRIEAHKVLGKEDPALFNLLELILNFDANCDLTEILSWARDLTGALNDAIRQIHETKQ
jgi:RNase P/RNase MRP subunit POP5